MDAILVAAGSSRRMGFDKMLAPLAGRPVIAWTMAAFEACADVRRVFVTASEENESTFAAVLAGFSKLGGILPGGAHRHLSVWHGLQALGPDAAEWVAVHDGGRPLVTPTLISRVLARARECGAAAAAAPVADTLKLADAAGFVRGSVDRTHLWGMQTPQIFRRADLVRAYESVLAAGGLVTDEVSALQATGARVALVPPDEANFKVTWPADITLAAQVLAARNPP